MKSAFGRKMRRRRYPWAWVTRLSILLIVAVTVMSAGATASAAPAPILDFDLTQGSGTTVVDSANGVVGTTHGTPWSTDPSGMPVLYFDNPVVYWFGDGDYFEIPYHAALNSPAMSIEAVVYPMSSGYYTSIAERIRNGGTFQTITYLGLQSTGYHTGRQPVFGLTIGGVDKQVISPVEIPYNAWSHIVGTYDGNDMRLYIDGLLVATELNVGGPRDTGSNPLYLGHAPSSNHYFNGFYAGFKLYDRALTAEEIAFVTGRGWITLVDEAGNPLANYPSDYPAEQRNLKYKYRYGGSWAPSVAFQTDANGQFLVNIAPEHLAKWDKKITVTLNQTTTEQNVTVNPVFQAAKVNANLESCTGPITDVPGGSVDQGGGYWYHHGNTGPSGTVTFYTFPASIKVRMSYNHNSLTLFPTIVAGTNEVDFQTTAVTLSWPGDIKSNKGGSWWMFSKPTMDLLPGDYNFWFKDGTSWVGPVVVTVGGCTMSKGYVLLRVLDENANGVAGGVATPAIGGSWQASCPGATDASGKLFTEVPVGYTKIRMAVNQGTQEQTLAQLGASNYTWTTEILRIWLKDHSGSPMTDGAGILDQGGTYWYNWGNLNASGYRDVQLFPGSHKFKMTYNYTSQQLLPVVAAGPGIQNFYFQTGQVFGPSTITQYSTGAWQTFTNGMELMPGSYTFKSPSQTGVVTAGGVTNLLP